MKGHRITLVAKVDPGDVTPAKVLAACSRVNLDMGLTAVGTPILSQTAQGPAWYQALEEGFLHIRLRRTQVLIDVQADKPTGFAAAYNFLRVHFRLIDDHVIEDLAEL